LLTREKPLAEDFRHALDKPTTLTIVECQGRAEICCSRAMGLP